MSQQPFRPASGGFDGGFFTPPPPPPPPSPPAWPSAESPGYGPPPVSPGASGPRGPEAAGRGLALGDVPPLVAVAAGYLVLAGVGALWAALSAMLVAQSVQPLPFHSSLELLVLLANGAGNLVLAYQLARGWELARPLVTGVCAWWVLYWMYWASKVSSFFGSLSGSPFAAADGVGSTGALLTLGLLLLSGWAALTAGLLWTPSASKHFS